MYSGVYEMKVKPGDSLLRMSLRANALFSAISGLALATGSYAIGPRIGVEPSWIVLAVGLGLLPFALDLFINSRRERIDLGKVKQAIAGDVLWVTGSIVVLTVDPTGLSTAGFVTIAAVAVVVAEFAFLQWVGLRRAEAAYASATTSTSISSRG